MVNGVKYAIMALIFIGIIKLLQVTVFDAKQYTKNKEDSFSKDYSKGKDLDSVTDSDDNSSEDIFSEQEAPPVLGRTEGDSLEIEDTNEITDQTEEDEFQSQNEDLNVQESTEANTSFTNESDDNLEDLKKSYLAPIIAELPPGQLREDIVIRYYRHDKDEGKVYELKELSYYIHEKEATETEGMGSNVIYYGDAVTIEDIKIVALTLLEEGIPLKSIERTQYDWKSNAIEIGTDTLLLDQNNLTVQERRSFRK